jgi:hypothetical protein
MTSPWPVTALGAGGAGDAVHQQPVAAAVFLSLRRLESCYSPGDVACGWVCGLRVEFGRVTEPGWSMAAWAARVR